MDSVPEDDPLFPLEEEEMVPTTRGGAAGNTSHTRSASRISIGDLPIDSSTTGDASGAMYSPTDTHVKTYTAGEDKSRLQQMARELGLQKARQPRKQVRHLHRRGHRNIDFQRLLQSFVYSSTEDARIRSILSTHHATNRMQEEDADFFHFKDQEGTGMEEPSVEDHHHGEIGGDLMSAVLGIIKGMVGPAILYLPHGFASAGYLVALPILAGATALFLYSSQCLLSSWKIEQEAHAEDIQSATLLSGSKTGGQGKRRLLLSYPELAYRALGERGESLVKMGIALMQSGVCLTYMIFVPQNLHTSMLLLFNWNVSPSLWLLVMIMIQIPLSWIRDIRKLTPTNLVANLLILYGLVTCLGFAVYEATAPSLPNTGPLEELWRHIEALDPFAKDWFLFIGTSVLLFEGSITLLVPLQEAVQLEEERAAFPKVYQRVIMGIISFYLFFGLTCWMAFGEEVRTVLTTSLPSGIMATSVQLAYSLAVIFTFPLQNFPALEITCRTISSIFGKRKTFLTQRNVLSSLLVCALAVIAVCTMESLDKVVSLMGSLLGCPIAFVFPPLIHLRIGGDRLTERTKWLDRLVAGLGFVAMVLASVTTLVTW